MSTGLYQTRKASRQTRLQPVLVPPCRLQPAGSTEAAARTADTSWTATMHRPGLSGLVACLQGVVGLAAVGGSRVVDDPALQAACCTVPQVRPGQIHGVDQLPALHEAMWDQMRCTCGLLVLWHARNCTALRPSDAEQATLGLCFGSRATQTDAGGLHEHAAALAAPQLTCRS